MVFFEGVLQKRDGKQIYLQSVTCTYYWEFSGFLKFMLIWQWLGGVLASAQKIFNQQLNPVLKRFVGGRQSIGNVKPSTGTTPLTVASKGLKGFLTKKVRILLVTVTGWGVLRCCRDSFPKQFKQTNPESLRDLNWLLHKDPYGSEVIPM